MKQATAFITPSQVVLGRVAFGFLPILIYAIITQQLRWNHLRHARHFLVMACLAAAIYYYGFARASTLLPSGIVGAMSGLIPMFSLIAAVVLITDESFSRARIAGLVLGSAGVMMIAQPFGAGSSDASAEGVLFVSLGALSLGVSFVYARRFIIPLKITATALATYQLGFATLVLMLLTDLEGITKITASVVTTGSLIFGLGILGTGVAYIIYYHIVGELGVVRASSVTYLPPIVALLIGALLVGEPIGVLDYVGTATILGGVILLNRQA